MESILHRLDNHQLQPFLWVVFLIFLFLTPSKLSAKTTEEDYFIFQINNKKGLRNSKDKVVIPAEYDDLGWSIGEFHPLNDVLGYKQDGLWGLITLENKKITAPDYLNLYPLNRQLIVASRFDAIPQEERYGITDLNGIVMLDFEYGLLHIFNNLIVASKKVNSEWKYGMINFSFQEVLPYKYSLIKPINNQYAIIIDQEMSGLVSASGQVLVPSKYHVIELKGLEFRGKMLDTYEIRNAQNQLLATHKLKNLKKAGQGVLVGLGIENSQLLNAQGQVVKSYPKTQVFEFSNGKAVIMHGGRFGVINVAGEILIPTANKSVWIEDYFLGVEVLEGKWDLLNSELQKVTIREYQEIRPATEGLFPVKRQNSWGFTDNNGAEVIPPQYQEVTDFEEAVAYANYLGSWGLIDKSGNWLIKPRFIKLEKITKDTYLFRTNTHYGLVNTSQEVVYQTPNQLQATKTGVIEQNNDQQYGLISLEGEQMLSLQYQKISVFKEDPQYYQFEDEDGKGIFNISQRTFARDPGIQEMRTLDQGYIGVRINDQYGFVDVNGKLRIANRYEDIGVFNEDMSPVKLNGKWGYVDRLERLKVQPLYETVDHFINDLAIVSQNQRFGLINKAGKVILALEYDRLERLPEGQFFCYQGQRAGLVDITGKVLLYPGYSSLQTLESGLIKAFKNGKQGLIDKQGKMLIPMVYDALIYDQFNDLYLLTRKYPWDIIKL